MLAAQTEAGRRADARRNHGNLLVVAKQVFAEEGANASLRDVARRAGVSVGTLYRHFPTRDALLEAVLGEGFRALGRSAEALLDAPSPGAALAEWLERFSVEPGACSGLPEILLNALRDESSALHEPCLVVHEGASRLLARAQEAGEARRDLVADDVFAMAVAIRWMAERADTDRAESFLRVLGSGLAG